MVRGERQHTTWPPSEPYEQSGHGGVRNQVRNAQKPLEAEAESSANSHPSLDFVFSILSYDFETIFLPTKGSQN